jgi:hypothetical protein
VIDVTVRHEDAGYLEESHRNKMEKYTILLPLLAEKLNKEPGKILPIVIRTRGAIPKKTVLSGRSRYYRKGLLMTIALLALRNSIEIYHNFMDYDKPRDPAFPVDPTQASFSTFLSLIYVLCKDLGLIYRFRCF